MRKAFAECAAAYLEALRPYRAASTVDRIRKNLRTVEQDLQNVEEGNGSGLATAPARIGEEHVAKLLLIWKGRGLDPAPEKKYLGALEGMLVWTGRPLLARLRKMPTFQLPKAGDPEPEPLEAEELARLRAACEGWEGWRGTVASLLTTLLPETGLRPMEVLGARIGDLNLRRMRMLVANPKVKNQKGRFVPLSAAARQALSDYLPAREQYLGGEASEWLLPLRRTVPVLDADGTQAQDEERAPLWVGVVGPWADSTLRKLAADLRERTRDEAKGDAGVAFSWKSMRSTFGQRLVDSGVPLEQTSMAMRHKHVETTRRYYVHLDEERALKAAIRALDGPAVREE